MNSWDKKNILGIGVNNIDYQGAITEIIASAKQQKPLKVTALAVHGLMTGFNDAQYQYILNEFDLVLPDGQPIRWALNWIHNCQMENRVYGPELMLKLCKIAAEQNLSIYLYGSTDNVMERLVEKLKVKVPQLIIAGYQPSFFRQLTHEEQVEVHSQIIKSGAALVFVGLGCPRQEIWCYENSPALFCPLIAVGAAFDFHAEQLSQAPSFMQRHGLEWLYRFIQEPVRLWRRYLLLNPAYLFNLVRQKKHGLSFLKQKDIRPLEKKNYG